LTIIPTSKSHKQNKAVILFSLNDETEAVALEKKSLEFKKVDCVYYQGKAGEQKQNRSQYQHWDQ